VKLKNLLGQLALLSASLTFLAIAQAQSTSPCSIAQSQTAITAPNIFNDHAEQDLGDALAEMVEANYRIAKPLADDQLTRIGEKLLKYMPAGSIHYTFRVYDSGEINAFAIAGGRVYISRKMLAAVKNEDELAGVVAHELGHLVTHQTAIELTRVFRIRLGITQVGDRADVFARVHQMESTAAKAKEIEGDEESQQLVADRISFYALVQAGYAPESFVNFLDISMANKGKTGSWITDLFGLTRGASQRYREARKLLAELPAGCKGRKPSASETFLQWKEAAASERVQLVAQGIEDDRPLPLQPPLRSSYWNIHFSPNGKYVLA